MCSQHSTLRWRQVILAGAVLVFVGIVYSTRAQPVPGGTGFSKTTKAANPEVPKYLARSSNRSPKSPPETKNQQAFKEAIENGNKARDSFEYEKAFVSYRKASELDPNEALGYYGLGNVYYDLYCYDSAIDFYSRATKRKPDYLEALIQLGYAYVNKERYDDAGAQFDTALNLKPKNIDATLGKLYVQAKKGKRQEAIDGINQLINDKSIQDKDRASAYIVLGAVYVAQKKWQESIGPYEKATHLNPDLAAAYLKLGMSQLVSGFLKYDDLPQAEIRTQRKESLTEAARLASENIRTAIDVKHYDHPNGYLLLGMALMYQSNYQGALSKINTYLVRIKELEGRLSGLDSRLGQKCDYAFSRLYADGYSELGTLYEREAGEADTKKDELINKAIEQNRKAIEIKQDYAPAYLNIGTIYLGLGRYRDAIEQYKKALLYETSESNKSGAYGAIGAAYARIGPDDEAMYYLKKAIELDPSSPSNYTSLAQVYKKQGNFDEAIRLDKEAIARERNRTVTARFLLAGVYLERATKENNAADYEDAIKLLNEVIKINPTFASAYLSLGHVYKFYKNGEKVDEAVANYEQASKYDPNNHLVYFSLGDLHASVTHNDDAAIKYLTEAIRLKPDYALAYWTLALVYREKKDDSEAIKLFLEGLKYQKEMNAYILLADTYDRQKNYGEAIKWLLEAVRLEPENHSPYLHLARVHTHQRKNDEAIDYYEKAITRLKRDDLANKNLYGCRIMRLRRQYSDALACFEKLAYPLPDQVPYEIGVTHVESGNKQAALVQHQQLVKSKSPLAEELLRQINEMK